MLPKKHRLAKTRDVQKVFARGRGFFNPYLNVKYVKTEKLSPRFTVVVSTKVSKRAVVRNRLKRLLREYIRLNFQGFLPGDYAVVVKPAAMKIEECVLLQEFQKVLKQSKLQIS
jgi:ribonuclease P protein component